MIFTEVLTNCKKKFCVDLKKYTTVRRNNQLWGKENAATDICYNFDDDDDDDDDDDAFDVRRFMAML